MTQRRRGRPAGRTKAETRRRILIAARKCFGRYGYDAATNRLIADEAGISPGAIYQHFSSKTDLYAAVEADCHRSILEAYSVATATVSDVRAGILAIIDMARDLHEQEPILAQFVIAHPVEVRRHRELADLPSWADTEGPLRAVARRAGAEQALPADLTPAVVADALWVVHLGLGRFAQAADNLVKYKTAVEACKRLFTLPPAARPAARREGTRSRGRAALQRGDGMVVADTGPTTVTGTERSLIDAAITSFADRGYASTTLQEIVDRAGLTTGAVYGHFGSKCALFVAAVDSAVHAVEGTLRAAVDPFVSLEDRVAAYVDAMIALTLQRDLLAFRMTVPVELARNRDLGEAVGDELGQRLALCRDLIGGARSRNRHLDTDDLAMLMVIVGDGLAWFSAAGGRVDRLATALHRLLVGRLLP
jgi:AcrR family transcriptional regulator